MRKRVAYIVFPQEEIGAIKRLDGLNVRFDVSILTQGGMPANARIEVYNPNREDLKFLTTTVRTAIQKNYLFQLYAGYEDDVRLMFSGQVFEAIPSSYPDVVLTIRGHSNVKWWGDPFGIQKEKITVMDLLESAASEMGYTINIDDNMRKNNVLLNKQISNYSFTGSPMELIEQVQSMVGGVSGDPDTIFISVYNEQINIWSPNSQDRTLVRKLKINQNTGMLGLPRPTPTGCEVDILMNTGIQTGDIVEIESVRMPILNGEYYVVSINHTGELRGNTWQTTLNCISQTQFKATQNE